MRNRAARRFRSPALALSSAVIFGFAAVVLVRGASKEALVADDPVALYDREVDRVLDKAAVEREIGEELAAGDIDIAQSLLDVAGERGVTVDVRVANKVKEARANAASVTQTAGRFAHGVWTGEPTDTASLAGVFVSDLFVFGDVRDLAREGTRYATGRAADFLVLGLAGAGIAMTAATYSSLGVGMPGRIGFSIVKAARRMGRLNPRLVLGLTRDAVKVEKAGGFVELASDVGRIESKAGTQAALDTLRIAEEPQDVSRVARLAVAKGGKTRAILKLAGPTSALVATSALNFAIWVFWAALALFGFVCSCKATVERATLRHLQRRKLRRAQAKFRTLALPSAA